MQLQIHPVFLMIALWLSNIGCQRDLPNIVIIMGDDIGFSDLGCYGSEIQTPNLDRLAYNGLRFRRFYNMAKCNPTRSSMITGLYHGDDRAMSFVSLLRDKGYSAIMSGKEHFDSWVPQSAYFANTFEQSLTFWATTEYFVPPNDTFERPFYLNGNQIRPADIEAEKKPLYKTDFITDYALRWLDEVMMRDRPFLLLLPYHVAHYPLQARPEDIAKYQGKYMDGWDKIRRTRFNRMIELGVVPSGIRLSIPEGNNNKFRGTPPGWEAERAKFAQYIPWDSLSLADQVNKDLEMAVYAAMIDRMDQNIGRLLARLDAAGETGNTLILFFTDNGGCPFDSNADFDIPPGPAEGYRCLAPTWANVSNTPYRKFKQNGHEGGSNTHFIAHWPDRIASGLITDQIGHVVDLFPTFLEIAKIQYPQTFEGKSTLPLDGYSLLPIFDGNERTVSPYFISGHTERFRMYRQGDWKIVRENDEKWELYQMVNDPTEMNDLSTEFPKLVDSLQRNYQVHFTN